jgi:hypothetical protein
VTEVKVDEFEAENPHVQEDSVPEVPVFVFALAMLNNGEIKVVTDLPFESQRKALSSDIVMLTGYVNDVLKRDAQV